MHQLTLSIIPISIKAVSSCFNNPNFQISRQMDPFNYLITMNPNGHPSNTNAVFRGTASPASQDRFNSDDDTMKKSSPHYYRVLIGRMIIVAVVSVIAMSFLPSALSSVYEPTIRDNTVDEMMIKQLGLSDKYPVYDAGAAGSGPEDIGTTTVSVTADKDADEPVADDDAGDEDDASTSNEVEEEEAEAEDDIEQEQEQQHVVKVAVEEPAIEDENGKESIFVDQEEYNKAPMIQVLPESSKLKYRSIVLQHERHYRKHPSRLYVPRLKPNLKLTIEEFADRFLRTSQPVIVPYEAMRHLGFTTRSFTQAELLKIYPNRKPMIYKYGGTGTAELDLGPAIVSLAKDEKLKKTTKGRNYPRNMKIGSAAVISKLTVQEPPYVLPGTTFMAPSLWFGSTTASTKFHSDCCDNFAMMVMGTKIWTVSPPSEARILHPKCAGGLCWVKSLEHPDEHANTEKTIALRDKLQRYSFELRPNEMLYLPCGWFHHVENKEPTIMVNWWTKSRAMFLALNEDGNAGGPVTSLSL